MTRHTITVKRCCAVCEHYDEFSSDYPKLHHCNKQVKNIHNPHEQECELFELARLLRPGR